MDTLFMKNGLSGCNTNLHKLLQPRVIIFSRIRTAKCMRSVIGKLSQKPIHKRIQVRVAEKNAHTQHSAYNNSRSIGRPCGHMIDSRDKRQAKCECARWSENCGGRSRKSIFEINFAHDEVASFCVIVDIIVVVRVVVAATLIAHSKSSLKWRNKCVFFRNRRRSIAEDNSVCKNKIIIKKYEKNYLKEWKIKVYFCIA